MLAKSISKRRIRRQHTSWLTQLLRVEPAWVLLLGVSLLFTEYFWDPVLRPLLIVALFLFWPLRLKAGRSLLPRGAAGWFTGFLLLWLPVTIWQSANSTLSWEIAGYIYFALATFVAFNHWPPLCKQPYWLMLLLVTLGVGLAVVGPEAFSVMPDKVLDVYRTEEFTEAAPTLAGEKINPNILAAALVIILPVGIALALYRRWARWPWLPPLLWAPVLIIANGLLLSQSRSSWLALAMAGGLFCWLLWPRGRILLLVAGLLGILVVLGVNGTTNDLANHELMRSTQTSLMRRLDIWRLSLQMVASNPVTGVGLGDYKQAFTTYFPKLPLVGGRLAPDHAHNLFVQLALDLGVPGLLAYVGLLATLVRSLWTRLQQKSNAHHSPRLAVGVMSALVAMLVVGCFDNALWGTKLAFIPGCLFALASVLGETPNRHDPIS